MDSLVNQTTQKIVVFGATGLQGHQVCEKLCDAGYDVVGVTRNRNSPAAQSLVPLGVELHQCDIENLEQLENLPDAQGIFLVLDSMQKDHETEFQQGINVIGYAESRGIQRFVYSSVGSPDADNNVAHFGVKHRLEQQLANSLLHWTILRPTAFMEGLVEKKFVPPVLWHVWSRSSGWDTPIQWIAVEDIAKAAAYVFDNPSLTTGKTYTLVGDQLSLGEVQQIFVDVDGKAPRKIPMPVWLFRKLVSQDLYNLFRWYKAEGFQADPNEICSLAIQPLDFSTWLAKRRQLRG